MNAIQYFCYRRHFVTGDVLLRRRFVTGDVLLRRRFIEETFCSGDVLLGDVLSRRRFVRRRFVCASKTHTVYYNISVLGSQTLFKNA